MKTGALIGAALIMVSTAVNADVSATEEMAFDVKSGARVSLDNINGEIRIVGGPGNQVKVVAEKKAGTQEYLDGLKVTVDASEDYIRIETRHPKGDDSWFSWGKDRSGSVSYRLTVPSEIELNAITTVNGDVTIDGVAGVVQAETVNGSVEAAGLMSDADFETVNGSISAEFEKLGAGQRVSAEAVNGKIQLRIPGDSSARVTAETVNGSIDADDFGLEPEKGFIGRDLSGAIGAGEARISLDTVNGSIKLQKR
jgi:hypothetical protein